MTVRPRIVISLLVTALVAGAAWLAGSATAATMSPSSYSSRLLSLVNQARAHNGLGALSWTSGTSEVAQSWSGHLAAVQALSHNPSLGSQLESHGSPDWTALGENVGVGAQDDPDGLFTAYMNSPAHRANILNGRYRYVGMGEVYSGGRAWNTMDFVDSYGSTTRVSAPAPAPAPAPAKQQAAPRTTTATRVVAAPRLAPVGRMAAPAPKLTVVRRAVARPATAPTKRSAPQPRTVALDGNQARAQWSAAKVSTSVLGVAQTRSLASLLRPDPRRTPVVALALVLLVLVARRWLRAVAQPA